MSLRVLPAIVFGMVMTLSACAANPAGDGPGRNVGNTNAGSVPGTETIAVIGRGWHTELGLSTASLGGSLAGLAGHFPGAVTLTFGFGDRAFVLARHRTLGDALGALFPSPGLILITGLNTTPENAFGQNKVVILHVSRRSLERIVAFLRDSIASDGGPVPSPYGRGPYPGSLYYASTVDYDAFETCNTWIAEALRAGGIPVQATGVFFASEIMREVRRARALESR